MKLEEMEDETSEQYFRCKREEGDFRDLGVEDNSKNELKSMCLIIYGAMKE
jgi:hypothetical protein